MKYLSPFLLALSFFAHSATAVEPPFDPYLWLEEVQGKEAMQWVEKQNAHSTGALENDPLYANLHSDIKNILFAKDRVAFGTFYKGVFWNFWQDEKSKHGIIRTATKEEYKKSQPNWDIVLDFDELSKKENENWVYKGADRMDKNSDRALLKLSRGGKDAVVVREFDYATRQFVKDGFYVAEAKTDVKPIDENTIIIGTDFGDGSLTDSGYARILKIWRRGQPLSEAKTVFEVQKSDLAAGVGFERDGDKKYICFTRQIDFYHTETFLQQNDASLRKLPLPESASFLGIKNKQVYLELRDGISIGTRTISAGSILRFPLEDKDLENANLIFTPGPRQSISGITIRNDEIFISILDNIRGQVLDLKANAAGEWKATALPFPATGVISFSLKDAEEDPTDITLLSYTDFLTPSSQYLVHDEDGSYKLELLKSAPARFDASKFEVVQNFSTSKDGTQIPYFLLKRKDLVLDGNNPTILYGYGGFEISMTPYYSATIGKLWLERGGVYAIANIRGGGEFGPEWHSAALKEHRQIAFDDFISVAEDLISRKITSPAHLGISGGSNGGLLTGATMVQRPELFNAALIQVPLLDMIRYTKLLAGASWMGEYGDPENPDEYPYLLAYSPYHNVKADKKYPTPMFTTSTKDDRVHPAHARKMAARMAEQGHPFYFYENMNGGHAGSANLEETAHVTALEYMYLWLRLR